MEGPLADVNFRHSAETVAATQLRGRSAGHTRLWRLSRVSSVARDDVYRSACRWCEFSALSRAANEAVQIGRSGAALLRCRHGSALLPPPSFPARDHPTRHRLYLRFTLSYRDVEELLAERGLDISYETVRRWVLKFGPAIARWLRRRRPRPSDCWHLDEMVVRIAGERMYLWRAVDDEARFSTCWSNADATVGRRCG
jgi:hypothetical protein